MVYALLGNPNSGKTALFNALCKTGVSREDPPISYQEGKINGTSHTLLDLPGLYSLKALTEEEKAVIEHLKEAPPDAILNVVDLTTPEKDLYLTLSLLSLRLPTVLVLTKTDVGEEKSLRIRALEESLGIHAVAVCAPKKKGLETLKGALLHPKRPHRLPLSIPPPPAFYHSLLSALSASPNPRLALSLEEFLLSETPSLYTVNELKKDLRFPLPSPSVEKAEALIVFRRKTGALLAERAFSSLQREKRGSLGDRIFLSSPLAPFFSFLALLITFFLSLGQVSSTFSHYFRLFFDRLSEQLLLFLQNGKTAPPLASFMANGLLRGVGSVLSLLPIVWIFSFLVSLSRESGYTKRGSFFLKNPLRGIKNKQETFAYLLLSAFLLRGNAFLFCFFLYLFLSAAFVFFSFLTRIFIKLPPPQKVGYDVLVPFRAPPLNSCLREAFQNAACLIKRCFSTVFLCSAGVWLLGSVTQTFAYTADKNESLLAILFTSLLPLFAPIGISDWQSLVGLLIALFTKEGAIAALAILSFGNNVGNASFFTKESAISFLLFILPFSFCSSVALPQKKANSVFLSLLILIMRLFIAFLLSTLAFWLVSRPKILL